MAEAIAMIQTRRSDNIHGVLHSYKSVCKELEAFGSDLLALSSERLLLHATRIAGRGTLNAGGTPIAPTHKRKRSNTHPQNKMATSPPMCLEDQRLKQAYCDSDRFQVSPFGVL